MDNRVTLLADAIGKLREFSYTQEDLKNVKTCIDKFFIPDSKCTNFIYTNNTDKLPFGCIVFPMISGECLNNFFIVGDSCKITEYEVELDSKLFDYGLSNEQVASIVLFNVYHMIKDSRPWENIREAIDNFFTDEGKSLVIKDSVQYQAILMMGLVDALNQVTSCFYLPNEVVNDPYLESLGLDELETILNTIYRQFPGCENEASRMPKLSMLNWSLRLYSNVDKERLPSLCFLNQMKSITSSILYINKFNAVINALNRIDTDMFVSEAVQQVFTEAKRRGGLLASLKYNGLRDIESDLYEFTIRAKNAETEQEVMYALKQINARLALLDDYIYEHQDDPEIERWTSVKFEYLEIRDILAKKRLHKRSYGVFVDYDKIDQLYDEEEN